ADARVPIPDHFTGSPVIPGATGSKRTREAQLSALTGAVAVPESGTATRASPPVTTSCCTTGSRSVPWQRTLASPGTGSNTTGTRQTWAGASHGRVGSPARRNDRTRGSASATVSCEIVVVPQFVTRRSRASDAPTATVPKTVSAAVPTRHGPPPASASPPDPAAGAGRRSGAM